MKTQRMTLSCSFCGKSETEVATLVTGWGPGMPIAAICNECVEGAQHFINEQKIAKAAKAAVQR